MNIVFGTPPVPDGTIFLRKSIRYAVLVFSVYLSLSKIIFLVSGSISRF